MLDACNVHILAGVFEDSSTPPCAIFQDIPCRPLKVVGDVPSLLLITPGRFHMMQRRHINFGHIRCAGLGLGLCAEPHISYMSLKTP
jgi:hypothetical protein